MHSAGASRQRMCQESEEKDPKWSMEEDDEENTSQQRGSFRFGGVEVSKEKVNFAVLHCLKIRLDLQPSQVEETILSYSSTDRESRIHSLLGMQSE
ncbi:unnamed protein product [Heligmosomoides polygyrus]|uniref:COMM domain-containing protein n=1 Tax=Heligmosomoides polygyrus TaxID=6339 RepID=A0A183FTP1_HELPZ|nr:unnamed protein product [Heligmosomoides polygyrus]